VDGHAVPVPAEQVEGLGFAGSGVPFQWERVRLAVCDDVHGIVTARRSRCAWSAAPP